MKMEQSYDVIIIGSGPAGLGAAFAILDKKPETSILILEKGTTSSGGLRNDCKMNFTFPIGFPEDNWTREEAEVYLEEVSRKLTPPIKEKNNLTIYQKRAERLGSALLNIRQAHLGTDGGLELIHNLTKELESRGVEIRTGVTAGMAGLESRILKTTVGDFSFRKLLAAPGRQGFNYLQELMEGLGIDYVDHVVDVGIRVETKLENYPIVKDYYDPKFHFPDRVRTFCTNSGAAFVVKEKYTAQDGRSFPSVNGHAWSERREQNGLVNFAMLKTIRLTEPLASGQRYAEMLGLQADLLGGGKPIMQRVGDFRLGQRSKVASFNSDLFDFEPTLKGCTPGDISLAMPAKILRSIWKSMKILDTIIPGVLHPSTIMYYPEIKLYANKPAFIDQNFKVKDGIWMAGDGAGTSRGITAAWAAGVRAARGILEEL
ncbi:MAG: pyridine nucleotide-disulfide oxidoreductase [Spirochaetales bacterium]|nr:pyridine nucleotide-disulfide oxidoreductase [Spirochaetales bacterium]